MGIIILAQDVITEAVQVLGLIQHQVAIIHTHRLNKRHRGETIVIHLQRSLLHLQIVHLHHPMEVLQAEVHLVVVVVEAEVQDKINTILTSKIPSNSTFEGIFSFKMQGEIYF